MPSHLAESDVPPAPRARAWGDWIRPSRIARHLPRLSSLESNCLAFLCASVAFLAWFDVHFHEFWRDEVQALLIGHNDSLRQLIESRDAQFGALAGAAFAEGIVVREPIQRPGLLKHAT